jgi:hypothetical protein
MKTIEQKLEFLTTQELQRYEVIFQREYLLTRDRGFELMRDYVSTEFRRRTER